MAFDGNGNYLRIHNWTADAANGLDINAGEMDAEDNSIAAALSDCITRDGQGKASADQLPAVDNSLNLGSALFRWLTLNGLPVANFLTSSSGNFARTPWEVVAGVTPSNLSYLPGDLRRYGGVMDGTTDDSPAWAKLAAVIGAGGSGFCPPLPTMIKSPALGGTAFTITAPNYQRVKLSGYGCTVNILGSIFGVNVNGGFMGGLTIEGFEAVQGDSLLLGFINFQGTTSLSCQNCFAIDCWLKVSQTIAPSASMACVTLQPGDSATDSTGSINCKVIRCGVRQPTGTPANYSPFSVLVLGACNETEIAGCNLASSDYQIGIYNQTGNDPNTHNPATGTLANGVKIHDNSHESSSSDPQSVYAVIVNGNSVAGSHIEGLQIGLGQRYEALTGGVLLLQGLGQDSSVPTLIDAPAEIVSSVAGFITQNNIGALQVTVNTRFPSITPSLGGAGVNTSMSSNGPWIYTNTGQAAVDVDALVARTPALGGVRVMNGATTNFTARNRSGGGAIADFPNLGNISGVDGLSRTNSVRRRRLTFQVAFVASATAAVTFSPAEPDGNYMILPEPNATCGALTPSAKTAAGFTLTAANSNSQTVNCLLVGL